MCVVCESLSAAVHVLFYNTEYIQLILFLSKYEGQNSCYDARLCEHTLTCFLRVVQGVSEGEELALRASSMSRLSWSSFLISWLIDSDQGDLTCRDSCG